MGATLDALHRLQTIEDRLRSLRERIESKQRAVQARQRKVTQGEKQIADVQASIQRAQAESDNLELERRTREEHVNKLREDLNRTKSNKEYAAVLTQLNTEKADILRFEDKGLGFLTQVDEYRKQEGELQAQLAKAQAQVADLAKAAQALENKLSAELKDLEQQREEAADHIPPAVLNTFERACERHDGEAMALLEKTHPKRAEYICSGCNMSIPLEIVNALQSRDEIQLCQTCQRILYLEVPANALA